MRFASSAGVESGPARIGRVGGVRVAPDRALEPWSGEGRNDRRGRGRHVRPPRTNGAARSDRRRATNTMRRTGRVSSCWGPIFRNAIGRHQKPAQLGPRAAGIDVRWHIGGALSGLLPIERRENSIVTNRACGRPRSLREGFSSNSASGRLCGLEHGFDRLCRRRRQRNRAAFADLSITVNGAVNHAGFRQG